jgi:hypothetical protein
MSEGQESKVIAAFEFQERGFVSMRYVKSPRGMFKHTTDENTSRLHSYTRWRPRTSHFLLPIREVRNWLPETMKEAFPLHTYIRSTARTNSVTSVGLHWWKQEFGAPYPTILHISWYLSRHGQKELCVAANRVQDRIFVPKKKWQEVEGNSWTG